MFFGKFPYRCLKCIHEELATKTQTEIGDMVLDRLMHIDFFVNSIRICGLIVQVLRSTQGDDRLISERIRKVILADLDRIVVS